MDSFRIIGGKKLKGEIIPQGAKNEALQIISATLLTSDKITINNIPDIKDVMMLIELLKELGVKVEKNSKNSFSFSLETLTTKRPGPSPKSLLMKLPRSVCSSSSIAKSQGSIQFNQVRLRSILTTQSHLAIRACRR